MERRPFGPVPREVAVIGQGTWYIDDAHRPTAVAALRRGLDLGMTHIDTAEMYGDAEIVVGEAIAGRRDELFLVSKVLPGNASRSGTIAACERSLARLRTDRLDCFLLHWPGSHPLEETFAAFERLREQGKILSWGVSNFDVPDLEAAWKVGGEGRIACNQILYNLGERAIEHAVLPWCAAHGVAVVAYYITHGLCHGGDRIAAGAHRLAVAVARETTVDAVQRVMRGDGGDRVQVQLGRIDGSADSERLDEDVVPVVHRLHQFAIDRRGWRGGGEGGGGAGAGAGGAGETASAAEPPPPHAGSSGTSENISEMRRRRSADCGGRVMGNASYR